MRKLSTIVTIAISLILFIILCILFLGRVSYYTEYREYGDYTYFNSGTYMNTGETYKCYVKVDYVYKLYPNKSYTSTIVTTEKQVMDYSGKTEYRTSKKKDSEGMFTVVENNVIFYPAGSNINYSYEIKNRNLFYGYHEYERKISGAEIFLIIVLVISLLFMIGTFIYNYNKKGKIEIEQENK